MDITLTNEEQQLLKKVLETYYADLREEIYKTEGHDFKVKLKEEEAAIKELIAKLSR